MDLPRQAIDRCGTVPSVQDSALRRARNPAVPIVEGMDGDKPEVCDCRMEDAIDREGSFSHARSLSISASTRSAGVLESELSRPTGPERTCMGPSASSRQPPVCILRTPE